MAERSAALCPGPIVELAHLPEPIRRSHPACDSLPVEPGRCSPSRLANARKNVERCDRCALQSTYTFIPPIRAASLMPYHLLTVSQPLILLRSNELRALAICWMTAADGRNRFASDWHADCYRPVGMSRSASFW